MENDDDTFLIIVGDSVFPAPFQIKEEVLDGDTNPEDNIQERNVLFKESLSDVKEILSDGIKEKPKVLRDFAKLSNEGSTCKNESIDYHQLNEIKQKLSFDTSIVKDEPIDYDANDKGLEMTDYTDDDEYIPDIEELTEWSSDECDMTNKDENVIKSFKKRTRPVKSSQRYSYVKVLMKSYPELKKDKKLLIDCIAAVMKSTKAPPLPLDYYIMNGIMLECIICGYQSQSIPAAGRHYQHRHGSRYLFCFACGVNFRSTTNLYKHEKRCDAPDAVTVLKARAIHLGLKGRSRPFLVKFPVQEPQRFNCTECSASFRSKSTLISHQYMHSGARPYLCPMCPRAYTSNTTLARHIKKHGDERFICDNCQRVFNARTTLIAHMDTHRPLKRFPCSECPKRFAQRAALVLHVDREHRGLPPPCACTLCPKRYPRMSILKNHMRTVHGMMLITRKMFFKSLPTLTSTQVQQAKVVMRSEVESQHVYYSIGSVKGRS